MPKFYLLYFKNLLDYAFMKFFEQYNSSFQNIDGQYVLSKDISNMKLFRFFKQCILKKLNEHVEAYDRFHPAYYLIIGSCMPKDNILLKYKDSRYFPQKIERLLNADFQIKYVLKEKDIKIDLMKFNTVCFDVFDCFFKQRHSDIKNAIFIQNRQLDCYMLFKSLKHVYGKSNCINMFELLFKDQRQPIFSINDLIDKYVEKTSLNKSQELKNIQIELKQFVDERIKQISESYE